MNECPTIVEKLPNGKYRHRCPNCGFDDSTITTAQFHRPCSKTPNGPGRMLMILIADLGIPKPTGCDCTTRARQMDRWGPELCREHRAEIVLWLKESVKEVNWPERIRVAGVLMKMEWFYPFDPYGSLVDEAVRRAEETCSSPP